MHCWNGQTWSDIPRWAWEDGTCGQLLGALGCRDFTHGVRGGDCFPFQKQEKKWEKNLMSLYSCSILGLVAVFR